MEEKRRVILFLLLVTLSSVTTLDFTYSESAYEAILSAEFLKGRSYKEVKDVDFLNMDYPEELFRMPRGYLDEEYPETIQLFPQNINLVETALSSSQSAVRDPLMQISITFRKIPHRNGNTMFGILVISFGKNLVGNRNSYFKTHLFSAPQTPESQVASGQRDEDDAGDVPVKLNPLSQDQVTEIRRGNCFVWKLSCLEKVLSSGIKKVHDLRKKRDATIYVLKPIIVDEYLLQQYFALVHSRQEDVKVVNLDKCPRNLFRSIQVREIGGPSLRLP